MSPSAISMFVFGIYIAIAGTGYLLMPNKVLSVFNQPKTQEPWIRVLGLIVLALAFYYIVAAQNELTLFFWMTVVGRLAVAIGFVLFVVLKVVKPFLLIFAVVEAGGALWTMLTM